MWRWLKDNVDPITSGASILGVLVAGLGFGVTYWQLQKANTALRASNTYEVQRDARNYIEKFLADGDFLQVISGKKPATEESQQKLWLMFNFYRSVQRQEQAGGLTSEFVDKVHKDFCDFLAFKPVDDGWNQLYQEKRIGDDHANMRKEWCQT